jgi:excisionase family DNA binding protein
MSKKRPYLTPTEAAEMLMVSPITVRQWAARGILKAELTLGGHRRFLRQDIESIARERGVTLPGADRDDRLRVLIVDDDEALVKLLTEILDREQSVTTESAFDGFDAGKKVEQFEPDVLLLDLLMPGLDGFEVCRRLKADPASRDIRIIVMTGDASPANIRKALAAGAELCLEKPLDYKRLIQLLISSRVSERITS